MQGSSNAPASAAARAEALRYNFISCLILTAQNGFGRDVDHLLPLCRETWGEEQWWDAVKDLRHGALKLQDAEGRAMWERDAHGAFLLGKYGSRVRAVVPLGAKRTHLMYAAQAGDVARLAWLLARGARLELKDWRGRTALLGRAGGARGHGAGAARAGRRGECCDGGRRHAAVHCQREQPV